MANLPLLLHPHRSPRHLLGPQCATVQFKSSRPPLKQYHPSPRIHLYAAFDWSFLRRWTGNDASNTTGCSSNAQLWLLFTGFCFPAVTYT